MREGPRRTVLVVDDEPGIRLLCRVNLELDGYDVLEAASIGEARSQLDSSRVDVVLLDLHLGTETSRALLDELGEREPRVPVALVTGVVDLPPTERDGADAVLPKPFPIEALTETVRRLAGDR